jgi:hypothetical protein
MKGIKLTSMAAASMLAAATTFAQNPGGAGASAASQPAGGNRVTITGCVERADQLNASGGSTAGASVDSLDFVLIKAEALAPSTSNPNAAASASSAADSASKPSPVGTSGSSAAPIYRLQAPVEKLNPHVGHKVEVTGTRDAVPAPGTSAPTPDPANPSTASAPRLVVESVKMLADSCGR